MTRRTFRRARKYFLFSIPLLLCAAVQAFAFPRLGTLAVYDALRAVEAEIAECVGERTVSFYYESLETGMEYKHNEEARYRSASTTKLPVVLAAYQMAAEGRLNLEGEVEYIEEEFWHDGSGRIRYAEDGTLYTFRELVWHAVHFSDNVAYKMLRAENDWYMHPYIRRINAVFVNEFNAGEVAVYMREVYRFAKDNGELGAEFLSFFVNTYFESRIPAALPHLKVAHKIGSWTVEEIYHDAAVVFDEDPYVLVIMTYGEENNNSSFFVELTELLHKRHLLLHEARRNAITENSLISKEVF